MLNEMPILILVETVVLIVAITVAVVAVIRYQRKTTAYQKLLQGLVNTSIKAEQKAGYSILHRAINKAQAILGLAELEGIKVVAGSKITTRKLETEYENQLSQTTANLATTLNNELNKAQSEFTNFINDLRQRGIQSQLQSEEYIKQRTNEIFERFETNLSSFLTQTEQKSVEAVELELRAAKQLIDTYKTRQLALIDENIIAMLERTLSLVLTKKLTLKDQLDLVYEALEKAKIEKFVA